MKNVLHRLYIVLQLISFTFYSSLCLALIHILLHQGPTCRGQKKERHTIYVYTIHMYVYTIYMYVYNMYVCKNYMKYRGK